MEESPFGRLASDNMPVAEITARIGDPAPADARAAAHARDGRAQFTAGRFTLFITALLALLFPTILSGTDTFFYRDYGVLAYPTIYHAHVSFWRGELPLWNPLSNCGVPFLAQWGTMVLYPFSLFYLLLPLPWSINVFCLAHLVLAGLGMYRLALRWTGDRSAASLAGTGFVCNGVTLSCLMWPNYTVALAWMPWVVLCVERAWKPKRTVRSLLAAAVVAALQLLAGVPEIVILTWGVLGALWGAEFVSAWRRNRIEHGPRAAVDKSADLRRLILSPGAIILLVAALVAAQLLPFLDLLTHSQRNGGSATLKWALPPWGWGNLFNPMFRCAQTFQGIFFQIEQEFFGSTYLGVILLALALSGAWSVRRHRVWLLAALAASGLGMTFGDHFFLYRGLRTAFPILGFARYPVKFILLVSFAVPLLAAYGVRALLPKVGTKQDSQKAQTGLAGTRLLFAMTGLIIVGVLVTLALTRRHPTRFDQWPVVWHSAAWRIAFLFALAGVLLWRAAARRAGPQVRNGIAAVALVALVVADAHVAVPQKNPVLPSTVMAPGLWEMGNHIPPPHMGEGRVMISPTAEDQLLTSSVRDLKADFLFKRLALWSNLNLLDQVPKVNGSSTLQMREQKQIESAIYDTKRVDPDALAGFFGAAYVTAPGQVFQWTNNPSAASIITAGQQPVFGAPREILESVTTTNFDSRQRVWLPLEAKGVVGVTNAAAAKVGAAHWTTHRIEADIEAVAPSMVVIAQSYYHNWRPSVGGTPVRLWRANGASQAVEVPAGHHHLVLEYVDRPFQAGVGISLAGVLACAGLWWRGRPT